MSYLLDAVREARDVREGALEAFRVAVERAKTQHSYSEIAAAAGMSRAGIQHVLRRKGKEQP